MDFVLALHSHLPYVLNHGRWPHGSDWLTEAAIDTYLPLLEQLQALEAAGIDSPLTIGFTPVLANQLASPLFVAELEGFFAQRLLACDEAPASLTATGDQHLLPLVEFWRSRLLRLRTRFRSIGGDLVGGFRAQETAGRIEIIGSAATHGFLPLLGRDESIRLQLFLGQREHHRLFGRLPTGCWIPECGYRPRGEWAPLPDAPSRGVRRGIEEHLADAGFRYFFTDAHLAHAGMALGAYAEVPLGAERFDAERADPATPQIVAETGGHSPYQAYRVGRGREGREVATLVRDPRSSMQVWSRRIGYPGDQRYLEFHKIRWPGGLKLWRVSPPGSGLGDKLPYEPGAAMDRVLGHAEHFVDLLGELSGGETDRKANVIVAPFDTELFGHWWFEGTDFLAAVYRRLAGRQDVRGATATAHLDRHPPRTSLRLETGSWGAHGDYSMWLNPATAWTWRRLWPLESAFWDLAPQALANPSARPVLAQAARSLLLAQSSDWQFIISTGAVADYGERRFNLHCDDLEQLLSALDPAEPARLEQGHRRLGELGERDQLFPDILPAVEQALRGSRGLGGAED